MDTEVRELIGLGCHSVQLLWNRLLTIGHLPAQNRGQEPESIHRVSKGDFS